MYRSTTTGVRGMLSGWLICVSLTYGSSEVAAQTTIAGADEFRISCASCHGVDGKGSGQMASILKVKPTDLTTLAKTHQGEFPETRVYGIIDGREAFYGHGDRAMPVWGIRYLLEHALRYGGDNSEQVVRARITKLVNYIRSIQE